MSDSEKVIYTVLEVFIAIACCPGNLLVIWAVWSSRVLRKTTFCFVVSLAVADFLVGAVVVPLAVLIDGRVQTRFYTCLFISCVVIVLTQASVHSLLAIAVDRFLRIYNPLRYRGAIKKQNLWAAVTICWVSASFLGFVPLLGWHNEDPTTNGTSTFTCQFLAVIPMSYMVNFFFFVYVLPPTVVMFALYLYIFCTISKQLRKGIGQAAESRSFLQKERELASSLALVLALFAICWFPIHIINTLAYNTSLNMPPLVFYIGILLSHSNSAVNPIVYAFKVPKIKTAYKNILMKLTSWKQNTDQSSQNLDKTATSSNTNIRYKVKNTQDGFDR
ncbi:adenosine receptor A1-like [Misgurnus anguillicaudatus]|uniref:adenosine receptor A1-like n=1 Tax=Misgurnus anguillicaudatus TaxID=75329 RepID=UPI003CCF0D9E